ncbi:CPBP family intramembrane glutamic endopeptidase [Lysinibacillus antri]|uniref:CPBP family intramembrane metalloprotease n=1 Tax=Lysinibacillus antri TaxID=2498145 RepID=A0A432L9Y9_9BACI|nr:type II CAAX endopeptidase family protein [Lysinibacillus antri]RUL50465.1 CPBP family intramembrane metalloprotease [Lysinibacillus antri]
MKIGLMRIVSICVINFMLNYLLLFPLGLFKYITTPDLKMFALAGIVVSGIPALATLLFYKLVDRKQIRSLGFQFKRKDLLFSFVSIASTILLVLIMGVLASSLEIVSAHWNSEAFSEVSFYLSIIMVFVAWFVAAFYEEILFRGYFVANLSFLSMKKLYVITSLIFMVFHIFKGLDPISIVLLMIMSCVMLNVYLKSGSLLPCTFAHLIFNFSTSHLVGSSDIAILKFDGDLGLFNLLFIGLYMIITILLTTIFYEKKEPSMIVHNTKVLS